MPEPTKVIILDVSFNQENIQKHFPNISLTTPIESTVNDANNLKKYLDPDTNWDLHGTNVILAFCETYLKNGGDPKKLELMAVPLFPGLNLMMKLKPNDIDVVTMSFELTPTQLTKILPPNTAPKFITDWQNWLEHQALKGRDSKGSLFVIRSGDTYRQRWFDILTKESDGDWTKDTMPQSSRYALVTGSQYSFANLLKFFTKMDQHVHPDEPLKDVNSPDSIKNTLDSLEEANLFPPNGGSNIVGSLPLFSDQQKTKLNGIPGSAGDVSALAVELLQINPNLTVCDIKEILILTANNLSLREELKVWFYPIHVINNINSNGFGTLYELFNGFGTLDHKAAISLARAWDEHRTYAEEKVIKLPISFSPSKENELSIEGKGKLPENYKLESNWQIRDIRINLEYASDNNNPISVQVELPPAESSSVLEKATLFNPNPPHAGFLLSKDMLQADAICFYGRSLDPKDFSFTVRVQGEKLDQVKTGVLTLFAAPRPHTIYFNESAYGNLYVPEYMQKIDCSGIYSNSVTWDLSQKIGKVFNQIAKIEGNIHTIYGSNSVKGDTLTGDDEDNTLRGNRGPDLLRAGKGKDIYPYMPGDDEDTIIDPDAAIIRLEKGYNSENTIIKVIGQDVWIYPCEQTEANLAWNKTDSIQVIGGLNTQLYITTTEDTQPRELKKYEVLYKTPTSGEQSYITLLPSDSTKLCLPEGCKVVSLRFNNSTLVKTPMTEIAVVSESVKDLFAMN